MVNLPNIYALDIQDLVDYLRYERAYVAVPWQLKERVHSSIMPRLEKDLHDIKVGLNKSQDKSCWVSSEETRNVLKESEVNTSSKAD